MVLNGTKEIKGLLEKAIHADVAFHRRGDSACRFVPHGFGAIEDRQMLVLQMWLHLQGSCTTDGIIGGFDISPSLKPNGCQQVEMTCHPSVFIGQVQPRAEFLASGP